MSKPYDATTKRLLETYPADWLALMGWPGAQAELIDADLSTLTAAADRLFRVHGEPPQIVHFELQAGYLATLDRRTLFQNVALTEKYDLPVCSVLVLLHPQASSPRFTGSLQLPDAGGEIYLQFAYRVVRVWELDAQTLLGGGIGALPLAPLARVGEASLPQIVRRMQQRFAAEASAEEAAALWIAT